LANNSQSHVTRFKQIYKKIFSSVRDSVQTFEWENLVFLYGTLLDMWPRFPLWHSILRSSVGLIGVDYVFCTANLQTVTCQGTRYQISINI